MEYKPLVPTISCQHNIDEHTQKTCLFSSKFHSLWTGMINIISNTHLAKLQGKKERKWSNDNFLFLANTINGDIKSQVKKAWLLACLVTYAYINMYAMLKGLYALPLQYVIHK